MVWVASVAVLLVVASVVTFLVVSARHGPTVETCTAEIVAHPREQTAGPGCRGLSQDQLVQATLAAVQQGAHV
jgi:hypothetical protein